MSSQPEPQQAPPNTTAADDDGHLPPSYSTLPRLPGEKSLRVTRAQGSGTQRYTLTLDDAPYVSVRQRFTKRGDFKLLAPPAPSKPDKDGAQIGLLSRAPAPQFRSVVTRFPGPAGSSGKGEATARLATLSCTQRRKSTLYFAIGGTHEGQGMSLALDVLLRQGTLVDQAGRVRARIEEVDCDVAVLEAVLSPLSVAETSEKKAPSASDEEEWLFTLSTILLATFLTTLQKYGEIAADPTDSAGAARDRFAAAGIPPPRGARTAAQAKASTGWGIAAAQGASMGFAAC